MTKRTSPHSSAIGCAIASLLALALPGCGGGGDAADANASAAGVRSHVSRAPATTASGDTVLKKIESFQNTPAAPAPTPWVPKVTDRWQWQLTGTINTRYAVEVYDIDLFDAPASTIAGLHAQGKYVVCYFSAGSGENWRPDYAKFAKQDLGKALDGWAGEKWLDTRSANVRQVMRARLDLAQSRGCDGVEPDNVDAYTNSPGFALTAATQLDYNRFLATEAHARGLKVGLKNDVAQVTTLAANFDFAVNEQCHQYNECGSYAAFTSAGKPVFNAEYKSKWATDAAARATLCAKARQENLRTLVLPLKLDDRLRYSCD